MRTVAIVSRKGGSGKTTLAVNLAVAAQQDGQAVLVVDLDTQASAHKWFKARADKSITVQPTHHAALPDVLAYAKEQGVDFVVIDTPGEMDAAPRDALELADVVLVPCKPTAMDLRALPDTVRLCVACDVKPYAVLVQAEPQGPANDESRAAIKAMKVNLLPEGTGRRAAYVHSINDGRGVTEYEPNGKAAQEIRALYQAICNLANKQTSKQIAVAL